MNLQIHNAVESACYQTLPFNPIDNTVESTCYQTLPFNPKHGDMNKRGVDLSIMHGDMNERGVDLSIRIFLLFLLQNFEKTGFYWTQQIERNEQSSLLKLKT